MKRVQGFEDSSLPVGRQEFKLRYRRYLFFFFEIYPEDPVYPV